MNDKRVERLGSVLMVLFLAGFCTFLVLMVLQGAGVIEVPWLPDKDRFDGDVPPGHNQGPNQVPVRPGSGAGGARGGR